jgi:hypothetical protein
MLDLRRRVADWTGARKGACQPAGDEGGFLENEDDDQDRPAPRPLAVSSLATGAGIDSCTTTFRTLSVR